MFAFVFLWTPPHFWSLSLFIKSDYANAGVPMMPVVAGIPATRIQVMLYTVPMAIAAVMPWPLGLTGAIYGVGASVLSAIFLGLAVRVGLRRESDPSRMKPERQLFTYSMLYLFAMFGLMVADKMVIA
jgi:protoheme IX farnesyltransferase